MRERHLAGRLEQHPAPAAESAAALAVQGRPQRSPGPLPGQPRQKRDSSFDVALEELEDCLAAPGTPERDYDARELSAAVNRFLAELPYEDRCAFLRRYWFGDEISRIADCLGMQPHRLSVRLSRIRKKLKKHLEKEGLL